MADVDDSFRQLCAIVQDCLKADEATDAGTVTELVKLALARRNVTYDYATIHRAVSAVLWHAERQAQRTSHPARPVGQFKSTLEATWADWLTRAGIAWDYEPKTFRRDALVYMPDFYLPDVPAWLEIKPRYPDYLETAKAAMLTAATKEPVYILVGPPGLLSGGQLPSFMTLLCGTDGTLTPNADWFRCIAPGTPAPIRPIDYRIIGDVLRQAGILPQRGPEPCGCGHTLAEHYNPADYAVSATTTVQASCRMHPCECTGFRPLGRSRPWGDAAKRQAALDAKLDAQARQRERQFPPTRENQDAEIAAIRAKLDGAK